MFVARGASAAVRDVRAEQQPLYEEVVRQAQRMTALVRELEMAGHSSRPVTSRGVTDENWTMGLRVQSSALDPRAYSALDPLVGVSITGVKQDWLRRLIREVVSQQIRLDTAIRTLLRQRSLAGLDGELGRPPRRGGRRHFRSGPILPRGGYGWGRDVVVIPEAYGWQMDDLVKESSKLIALVDMLGKSPSVASLEAVSRQARLVELAIRNARVSSGLGQADEPATDMGQRKAFWTGALFGFVLGAAGVYLITR
jgi:hypothetical protein